MEETEYHDGTSEYVKASVQARKVKLLFPDVGELELKLKRVKGTATAGPVHLQGEYSYNKDWKAKASTTFAGDGRVEAETNSAGDWQVKAAKPMFGGNLTFDATQTQGKRRYYVQYNKTF